MAVKVKLSNLNVETKRAISRELTIKPKDNFFNKFNDQPIKLFRVEDEYLYIPFRYYFDNFNKFPNVNNEIYETDIKFKGLLLERQVSVSNEALDMLEKNHSIILHLRPGFGKTALGIYLGCHLKRILLVLFDRVPLGVQWKRSFEKFSDASVWLIDDKEVPKEFNVILCSSRKFKKIPLEYREMIGCVIFDECHKFCTQGNKELLLTFTPQYVIALSATVERNNGMEKVMYAICGPERIIRRNEVKHTIYRVDTEFSPTINPENPWSGIIKQQVESQERNNVVYSLVDKLLNDKICILTSEVLHSEIIFNELKEKGHDVSIMSGKRKTYSDSRILVGTVSKIGTGFDEETCCPDFKGVRIKILILVSSNKSEGIIEQILGRSFRAEDPSIYSLVDDNRICKNHWRELTKWSKSNCGTIKEYKATN
jgi:superfamily II DNA or RNA helicase